MVTSELNTNTPLISIVIPVKNGIDTIKSCLDGIFKQTLINQTEIIVIDSASTDGTLDVLQEYDVKVHNLNPKDFNHGETRNLGVELSKGEFVVMTVQDATPVNELWLETMLSNFEDPEVTAVCGQQIVLENSAKNPLQWFRPASEAVPIKYKFENTDDFTSLSGMEQHAYCNWDDCNAMYRRSTKLKVPFKKLMFSEDTLWANDALSKGYGIVYDYRARVDHYHHQDFTFYFKRSYIILYQNYKFYNYIKYPKNPFIWGLQTFVRLLKMKEISFAKKIKWFFYNINLIAASWKAAIIFGYNARYKGASGVESSQKKHVGFPPQGVQAKQ